MSVAITKSDSQIKSDVLDELKWDRTVDDTDVGVQVHNGIVTLTGNVPSLSKKMAARDAAHRVLGVHDVVDATTVRLPSMWTRSEEEVAQAVRSALKWDSLVPDERITSTVSNGMVTLHGNVETWSQRHEAERTVERLIGVRGVINQLVVVGPRVNPDQIRHSIEAALERQTEREARRLSVSVLDGVVTITGTLRSWGEKNAIERAAGHAPGVRRVDDRTTVDPYQ